jgi:hypothetical protein
LEEVSEVVTGGVKVEASEEVVSEAEKVGVSEEALVEEEDSEDQDFSL